MCRSIPLKQDEDDDDSQQRLAHFESRKRRTSVWAPDSLLLAEDLVSVSEVKQSDQFMFGLIPSVRPTVRLSRRTTPTERCAT